MTSTDASHIVYNYSALLQLRSGFPKNLLFYIVQKVIIYKKNVSVIKCKYIHLICFLQILISFGLVVH